MWIFISYGIILFLGALVKVLRGEQLKWLVVAWVALAVVLGLIRDIAPGILLIIVLIKALFLYLWLLALKYFEDTIFRYLIILIVGGFLFVIFY